MANFFPCGFFLLLSSSHNLLVSVIVRVSSLVVLAYTISGVYFCFGLESVLLKTQQLLTAEYACSSWGRSRHTGHVDIALNDTCRIITGCLNAIPIPCLYALAGIAPPHIRGKVASNADSCLQEDDPIHPLHGQLPAKHRLPSRNSFLDSTEAHTTSKQDARTTLWVEEWNALVDRSTEWRDRGIIPNEHLASGTDEPWSTWRSLNRLRVQKGRCRATMKMWKLSHTDVCGCGERQTMSHLMTCVDALNCTWTDLAMPTLAGVNCAKHWGNLYDRVSRTRCRRAYTNSIEATSNRCWLAMTSWNYLAVL